MDRLRVSLIVIVAALVVLGLGGVAYAFHSGGVAECTGCHKIHDAPSASFLLVQSDASSTCLSCHESSTDTGPNGYHISTAETSLGTGQSPLQRTPGGDFGWLKKTYSWGTSASSTELGQTHGHNIIAVDKSYTVDTTNATAPGGTFPSNQLACNSCHDQHGKYRRLPSGAIANTGAPIWASGSYYDGSNVANNEPKTTGEAVGVYRLLAGQGYSNAVSGPINFPGVPMAKVPSTYNRKEDSTQTRTAYGVGTGTGHAMWGAWCGTCHPDMLTTSGKHNHPVDQALQSGIGGATGMYNKYVKTGDVTGTQASSFTSLVPFASVGKSYAELALLAVNNNSQLGGPESNDQVMCFSCHRAHASGFQYALRFNVENWEFMTYDSKYPGTDNTSMTSTRKNTQAGGRLMAEQQAGYYDRPPVPTFATYQRVLCNKCHAKD